MSNFFDDLNQGLQVPDVTQLAVTKSWRPSADFVLCRDLEGNPTAVYNKSYWDFNPMRLRANKIWAVRFDGVFETTGKAQQSLIDEIKWILFCLLFFVSTGHTGRISVGVLAQYFLMLRTAARFCYEKGAGELAGVLSLQNLFTTPAYLSAYARWMKINKVGSTQRKLTRALLNHLVSIGEERLGYKLQGVFDINFECDDDTKQHPVIPTRIYLGVINAVGLTLDTLYNNREALERYLTAFDNPFYGYTHLHQKKINGNKAPKSYEPEFEETLKIHELETLFSGDFSCTGRGVLSSTVLKMQWVAKTVIHLYTGMRDQEVLRLPYDCVDQDEVVSATLDDKGFARDKPIMVKVLSTTTKFTGYRKTVSWLATDEAIRAVEVARAICRGISRLYGVDPKTMPLFLNPSIINRAQTEIGVPFWNNVSKPDFLLNGFIMTASDLDELQLTEPSRDFASENIFQVGSPWNFTSHQFRRSLAFYGSSSGFISMPSLRKQFKHLCTQMTRYYANNFELLKTIFGYYDEKKGKYVLPRTHVLFEVQTGVPINVAYDLLAHAFGDDARLFGGVGTYISNQRGKIESGDVHIVDVRKETEKQAADGKISYRPTLLGACTRTGKCEHFLLGAAVSCLSCADGIIEKEKLDEAIEDNERDLELYEPGSGEYQVVQYELSNMRKFRERLIPAVEVA
ncbi:integrase [Pseudomonas faucium]|uniref:integrase n=1 Tax=Pseudomonas faucium TaxID=2740518 RepID=UPI00159682C1|nr:integrase [Pseudomonas faucium]